MPGTAGVAGAPGTAPVAVVVGGGAPGTAPPAKGFGLTGAVGDVLTPPCGRKEFTPAGEVAPGTAPPRFIWLPEGFIPGTKLA